MLSKLVGGTRGLSLRVRSHGRDAHHGNLCMSKEHICCAYTDIPAPAQTHPHMRDCDKLTHPHMRDCDELCSSSSIISDRLSLSSISSHLHAVIVHVAESRSILTFAGGRRFVSQVVGLAITML